MVWNGGRAFHLKRYLIFDIWERDKWFKYGIERGRAFHLKRSRVNPPAVEEATSLWYEIVIPPAHSSSSSAHFRRDTFRHQVWNPPTPSPGNCRLGYVRIPRQAASGELARQSRQAGRRGIGRLTSALATAPPTMRPPRPPPILSAICHQWIWEMLPNQTKPGWALGRQRLTSELAAIPIQPKSKLTKNKPNPGVFHSMKAEQHASNSAELPCHPLCPPSPGRLFSSQFFFVSSLLAP